MRRSRLLIGIAIVCAAGITVFQFVRHRADKRPSGDTPSHEPKTPPQHRIVQPTESPRPQPAGLHGTVIDAQGNAVSDVLVEAGVFEGDAPSNLIRKVCVQSTATDSRGEFRFPEKAAFSLSEELQEWIKPGPEESPKNLHSLLIASKEGYVAARCPIDFDSVAGPQKIVLRKAPEVSGLVVWEETQQPIPEAEIILESRSMLRNDELYQPRYVVGRTDEEGYFGLSIPAEGEAEISAWVNLANLVSPFSRITLVPGERITDIILAVKLGSATLIQGKVLDPEGGPVSEAEVHLSTDKRVGKPVKSRKDGTYQLVVPKNWPYQSYFLEDWVDKPNLSTFYAGSDLHVNPGGESRINLRYSRWDWVIWTPPAHAPPERLVAVHPDFEIGVLEVPFLGVGQVRQGVDIVLSKGTEVSGRVLDDSSEPVQESQIEIELNPEGSPVLVKNDNKFIRWRNRITPAEDGSFEIRFLREGSYKLTASHKDCNPQTKRLELGPHQAVEGFDFVLVRRIGFIRGRVLDQSGNPWPYGKVRAGIGRAFDLFMFSRWGVKEGYVADVKEDGNYELSRLKPGKCNVWLDVSKDYPEPEGILQATSLSDVPTGTEGANITVTQLPTGILRVRVVDQMQRPVERFHIVCSPLKLTYGKSGIVTGRMKGAKFEGNYYRSYTREAKYSGVLSCRRDVVSRSGEFVAQRVAPGSYFVSVKTDEHGEQFAEVKIEAGGESEVTFDLQALGRVEGRVVDSRGQPLERIVVRAMKMKDVLSSTDHVRVGTDDIAWEYIYAQSRAISGADGRFVLENLEQTEYRVTASPGFRWMSPMGDKGRGVFADVTVGQSGSAFVELVFNYGSSAIEGYVYGGDGVAVPSGEVVLEGSGQKSVTQTDEQGHYGFPDLPPGRYLVRGRIGPRGNRHYRGREVELAEGEHASVDIIAWGDGGIEGTMSLAGDAAAAAAWYTSGLLLKYETKLVLRELRSSGTGGGRQMTLPAGDTFEFNNIPAGTYEAHAYSVIGVTPEPLLQPISDTMIAFKSCYVKFVSEPQIVQVVSGSTVSVHFPISEACAPHYPIPDPATCDIWVPVGQ